MSKASPWLGRAHATILNMSGPHMLLSKEGPPWLGPTGRKFFIFWMSEVAKMISFFIKEYFYCQVLSRVQLASK